MKLSTWINTNGGTGKTGEILGVKRNCVYAWREGRALPRPHTMREIVTKTRGKVSYSEMVDEYLTLQAKAAFDAVARKPARKRKTAKAKSKATKRKRSAGF